MFLLCVVDWFDYVWFWFWLCCLGWFCSLMFQSGLGFWLLDWSFLLTVDFVCFALRVVLLLVCCLVLRFYACFWVYSLLVLLIVFVSLLCLGFMGFDCY